MIFQLLAKIKNFVFPVEKQELPKFLPMMMLFFLISLIYNILRSMKIALIISSPQTGAEIIPFLKVWCLLPGAILFTYLFTALTKRLNREQVFYVMAGIFLGFFLLFMMVLHPFSKEVQMDTAANILALYLPKGASGFVSMVRYWHLSLFYLCSELWSCIILSMLFWGFVNEVTYIHEAKRFYSIFAVGANVAAIAAGQIGLFLSHEEGGWERSVFLLLTTVLICGVIVMFLFRYLNSLPEIKQAKQVSIQSDKKSDSSTSNQGFTFLECVRHVLKSRYLCYLTLVVVGYNLVFNLVDVIWTDQLSHRFHENSGAINVYMSKISTSKGIIAAFFALFLSGNLIRRFGWFVGALVTPMIILVTSALFLPLIIFEKNFLLDVAMDFFSSPLNAAVFIGGLQNSFTRASKYTFFDATKEMAFIPLGAQDQRKAKAIIDGISSRLGKSGGSIIFQVLLLNFATISATVPYVSIVIFIMLFLWIFAIYKLNGQIVRYTQDEIKPDEVKAQRNSISENSGVMTRRGSSPGVVHRVADSASL